MKAPARRILRPLIGRRRMQPLFESLHRLALAGLSIGQGSDPTLSGERNVLQEVARRAPSGRPPLVFDVGAHRGAYLLVVRKELPQARVEAFEPSRAAFAELNRRFGGAHAVRLHNVAVADRSGRVDLVGPAEGSKASSLFDRSGRLDYADVHREPVSTITLEEFCNDNGIHTIDLLKLDVEGAELSALRGAGRLLADCRIDCIQFEFGACDIQSRTFFRDFHELLDSRYDIHRVVRDGLYRVDEYHERLEQFQRATNYVALLRRTAP